MTVRLHYYGSVFELDDRVDDRFWLDFIEDARADGRGGQQGLLSVTLTGGIQAQIPFASDGPLVVTSPREDHVGESTVDGRVYWDDGTITRSSDDD
jgi:hypothetical protein